MKPSLLDHRTNVQNMTNRSRLAVLVPLCMLCGCVSAPKPSSKAQIESVFAVRTELKVSYLVRDRKQHLQPNPKRYAQEVKQIEVSRCPTEFQSAWFDYVVALERAHVNDDKIDFTKFGKYVAAAAVAEAHPLAAFGILTSPTTASRQKHLEECLEDAWYGVERAAMNYGVKPER